MDAEPALSRMAETVRVLAVAGVATGVVVVGLGSRLAMLVLRMTSPDSVVGVESDDGFEIGRFTVSGTYNLLVLGAAIGIIGAGVYLLVAPRLIGPRWFRRFTTALAAGVVGGAMLIHADGIDFVVLKPTWLAIALFIGLPAAFGAAIGPVVDAVSRPTSWTTRGRRRWTLPVVLVVAFPLSAFVLVFVGGVAVILIGLGEAEAVQRLHGSTVYVRCVQGAWMLIAVLGLLALVNDVKALY